MEVRFARGARRHKVGKAHALDVICTIEPEFLGATDEYDPRLVWIGPDTTGRVLEIVALLLEEQDLLLVIHVMPQYRKKS